MTAPPPLPSAGRADRARRAASTVDPSNPIRPGPRSCPRRAGHGQRPRPRTSFDQAYAEELAQEEELVFICGHYEGYDERIKTLVTDEISLGDFVLTGGELAAMTIVDATVRLIPEVLGKEASHKDDSFSSGLLEFPQYTRPAEFRGMKVPDVLLSGHHVNIRRWRMEQSLRKTWERRPDLLENYDFTDEERQILEEIKAEGK